MKNDIIATLQTVDDEGSQEDHGDRIVGVYVEKHEDAEEGEVRLDIRCHAEPDKTLVIRMPLPAFVAALSRATLNPEG